MFAMATMVLCAGYGTRLRPLTDELPKPLMPVGDRPALAHILELLAASGLSTVVANMHHRSDDLVAWARDRRAHADGELALVHEADILGTAGGIAHAADALGPGPALVWNGDILAHDLRPQLVLEAFAAAEAELLWVVAPRPLGEGTVGLDEAGRVVRLRGQRFGTELAGADFLGVQVVAASVRDRLPASGCMVADVALPLLGRGGQIATYSLDSPWHDIGDARGLWKANLDWLRRRAAAEWVGLAAEVSPLATLSRALVGAGGSVSGAGPVEDCIVLPGAHLAAPAAHTIAARHATLRF